MRSFWVSWFPFSSTLYTSFADGGRCPMFLVGLFPFVVTTKTIPHSGSPLHHGTSQLLSISLPGWESAVFLRHSRNLWQNPPANQYLNKTPYTFGFGGSPSPENGATATEWLRNRPKNTASRFDVGRWILYRKNFQNGFILALDL
jgi:hypothetical protein